MPVRALLIVSHSRNFWPRASPHVVCASFSLFVVVSGCLFLCVCPIVRLCVVACVFVCLLVWLFEVASVFAICFCLNCCIPYLSRLPFVSCFCAPLPRSNFFWFSRIISPSLSVCLPLRLGFYLLRLMSLRVSLCLRLCRCFG